MMIDRTDRAIVEATQAGLPLVPAPYKVIAERLDISEGEVIARLRTMHDHGIVRRIGLAPNHYKLGLVANGMTVWDIEDATVEPLGRAVGALDCVTHCYLRPRHLPHWPYNLFAMVHGTDREEVENKRADIAALLGASCRASDILYSTKILKKTGLRVKPRRAPNEGAR